MELDALSLKVQEHSIPIYLSSNNGRLIPVGTGFLATRDTRTLLVTAAHCIRCIEQIQTRQSYKGPVVIAFGTSLYKLDKPHNQFSPTTARDQLASLLDVAFYDMSPFPNIIENASEIILSLNDIPATDLNNHIISVMGFPIKANKSPVPHNAKDQNKVIPHAQRNLGSPLLPNFDLDLIGLSNYLQYAFQWGAKDEHKQYIPLPRGMSGAPTWASSRDDISKPRIAGVFISYYKQHTVAAFTRIDRVTQFIDATYRNRRNSLL